MRLPDLRLLGVVTLLVAAAGHPDSALAAPLPIAQSPLYLESATPPLNMLVMGKDHKIYYEAYNDASDLNGDGSIDVGYRGWELKRPAPTDGSSRYKIDYYGYFNSYACYTYSGGRFAPSAEAPNKTCSAAWSGDFLNYLTTSRLDALRRVLYGGWRQTDSTTETILQGAYFPQDAHSWGKEYASVARDGFNISQYAPLSVPAANTYHLFAVTTVTNNSAPLLRVLPDSQFRVWNWLSIEGPVGNNKCFTTNNTRVDCAVAAGNRPFPGHPRSRAAFDALQAEYVAYPFGTSALTTIDCNNNACNLQGDDENYMTIITGEFVSSNVTGVQYEFRIAGDDNVDFRLQNSDGTLVTEIGCYPNGQAFATCATTSTLALAASTTYHFLFRHEEAAGGDGYRLEMRTRPSSTGAWTGWTVVPARAGNNAGLQNLSTGFYDLTPANVGSARTDYAVRVLACPSGNAGLRDSSCKEYPNSGRPIYKPTGLLHDFGETQRMYFGLITGSQSNNLEGGMLRRNVRDFATEITAETGVFRTDVNGIVRSIDRLRMIGGGYRGSVTDNTTNDANWAWNNGTGNCPSLSGTLLANGQCRMWGNPIAEMMYESLRYFAGAEAATPRFVATTNTQGTGEETTLGLTQEAWLDPYKSVADGGLGYRACAKPVQTVISDINPSYDGDLPGSAFTGAVETTGATPAEIDDFDAADVGDDIWAHEFGSSRSIVIGDVDNVTDGAPTAKTASSFGNIRGLSPEEPTKGGTYYAASVAHFGKITDINAVTSPQNMATYSVALASPLPRIEIPLGDNKITLVPFAKTVSGTFGDLASKPVNTIVDFYVQELNNFPGQTVDMSINGGRPKAVFRINYEDVEQGNDHDMDAIVRYDITANANSVTVKLVSEYAAGSANQNMGYVISGTSEDGVYLEVRDRDAPTDAYPGNGNGWKPYALNTPPGYGPGDCASDTTVTCGLLPLENERTFTPSSGRAALQLNNPLWYAAKYGGFDDINRNGLPDTGEWNKNNLDNPDNYFLVTNALTLKDQLSEAFSKIEADSKPTGGVAASGARRDSGFLAYIPRYFTGDWTGDVDAYRLTPDGALGEVAWSAAALVPEADERNIYAVVTPGGTAVRTTGEFTRTGLGSGVRTLLGLPGAATDTQVDDLIDYLRGDDTLEERNGGEFRNRARRLGDILNSQPEVLNTATYSYGRLDEEHGGGTAYSDFLKIKVGEVDDDGTVITEARRPVLFVGANDGMLHAFDASVGNTNSGKELFAVMPHASLANVKDLAAPGYTHRYYVDGSPIQRDAYIGGAWKTVLLSGLGAGGRSIIALDVTNPAATTGGFTADSILWEFNDPDLGYTFGQPRIGILENGTWVAVFGNGYNSDNHQAYLFVVDLAEGTLLKKIQLGTGTERDRNGLASPELTSLNANIYVDTAYAGDYHGNLWKVNLSGDVSAWGVAGADDDEPMFQAESPPTGTARVGSRQIITASVGLSPHHLGGKMVFFGTGRYMLDGDNTVPVNPDTETFYGIWDKGGVDELVPIPDRSSLQQQTLGVVGTAEAGLARSASNNAIDWATQSGWYMDLSLFGGSPIGERVLGLPTVGLGRVVFTTFTPLGDECTPGGENWLYVLNASTGGTSLSTPNFTSTADTTGDPSLGSCSGTDCAVAAASLGSGAPTVAPPIVTTPPVDPNDPPEGEEPVCTRACNKIKIGVLTPEGTVDFMILLPGRQSWREM